MSKVLNESQRPPLRAHDFIGGTGAQQAVDPPNVKTPDYIGNIIVVTLLFESQKDNVAAFFIIDQTHDSLTGLYLPLEDERRADGSAPMHVTVLKLDEIAIESVMPLTYVSVMLITRKLFDALKSEMERNGADWLQVASCLGLGNRLDAVKKHVADRAVASNMKALSLRDLLESMTVHTLKSTGERV